MRRFWLFNELDVDVPLIYSDTDILREYRSHVENLAKKLGRDVPDDESVIDQWVVVNWAWQL